MRAQRPQMSVIVATAYYGRGRTIRLAGRDGCREPCSPCGTPARFKARAGAQTLEEAFIALLPAEKRGGHRRLVVPPRVRGDPDGAAIEARDLTRRFGDFTAVDHVSFRIDAWRDLRLRRLERLRQDHDHEDAHRAAARFGGAGMDVRAPRRRDRRRRRGGASASCRSPSRSTPSSPCGRTWTCMRACSGCRAAQIAARIARDGAAVRA